MQALRVFFGLRLSYGAWLRHAPFQSVAPTAYNKASVIDTINKQKKTRLMQALRVFFLFVWHFVPRLDVRLSAAAIVELPGFEPRITGPESVVLPLHHSSLSLFDDAKVEQNFTTAKFFSIFFHTFVYPVVKTAQNEQYTYIK